MQGLGLKGLNHEIRLALEMPKSKPAPGCYCLKASTFIHLIFGPIINYKTLVYYKLDSTCPDFINLTNLII